MKNPTLYDHLGRPIEFDDLDKDIATPISGVRDIWVDSTTTNLTPDRLHGIFTALRTGEISEFITLADDMEESNPHYQSVLGTRRNALAGIEPTVESADDSAAAKEQADAVWDLLRRPEFTDLVEDLLDGLGKGFAVSQMIWNTDAAVWYPREYKRVDQRWFQFTKETAELRLRDRDNKDGLPLAPFKYIIHYPKLKPSGFVAAGGLARVAAVAHMCVNYTVKDWMRFIELYGIPMRIGKYGPSSTNVDRNILKRAVMNIGADAAAIIPESMQIEFIETAAAAGGHVLFKTTADYMNDQISKVVLGQTASVSGTPGKLGNDTEQGEVRKDILKKDARKMAATLNMYLVRAFIDLNFGPQENYPAIKWVFKDSADLNQLGGFLAQTVPLGLKVGQSTIRDMAGLPDPEKNEEVLVPPSFSPDAGGTAFNRKNPVKRKAATALNNAEQDVVDELEEEATDGWKKQMTPIKDVIEALAEECETAEEFKARLPDALNKADLSELETGLALATFIARGEGDAETV
ncbi:MAG: DUF935 domain-containing protein [Kiritimatiellales bacterium]